MKKVVPGGSEGQRPNEGVPPERLEQPPSSGVVDFNGLGRPMPAVLAGVDLNGNADRMLAFVGGRAEPNSELERLLGDFYSRCVNVHRLFYDPEGSKLMNLLFNSQ